MLWMKNLKINSKLMVMVLIPMIGLLYFSITAVIAKINDRTELGQLESKTKLVVKALDVIHELQKEQGMVDLFKPFTQLDSSMARKYGGTGLGLAICKTLVELMGGKIHAEENVEHGAIFIFTIQTKSFYFSESTPRFKNTAAEISDNRTPLTAKLHILVAEDHPISQMLLERILQKLGHTFDFAKNGYEVMDLLRKKSYDLIFMDLQMPEMDGFETAQTLLTEIPEQLRPYTIAVTSSSSQIDKDLCLTLGMIDFVNKPIKLRTIENVLERHFSQKT